MDQTDPAGRLPGAFIAPRYLPLRAGNHGRERDVPPDMTGTPGTTPGSSPSPPADMPPREARLWPVRTALVVAFTTALIIAASVFFTVWELLGAQGLKNESRLDSETLFDLLKLSFGVVAGAGALVALVVAYRKQRVDEDASARDAARLQQDVTRLHTERFTAAVTQLGNSNPAVRLGGVHALAGLADDAPTRDLRQTTIDVLCAYLRLPYTPESDLPAGDTAARHDYLANRQVRHTVIRLIRDHLRLEPPHPHSWQGHDFDFTDVAFDGANFREAVFSQGRIDFGSAVFTGSIDFTRARFTGGTVSFHRAQFTGGTISFVLAKFIAGSVSFHDAEFTSGRITFTEATFSGALVDFTESGMGGSRIDFHRAHFTGGTVGWQQVMFTEACAVDFRNAQFEGSLVTFEDAEGPAPANLVPPAESLLPSGLVLPAAWHPGA